MYFNSLIGNFIVLFKMKNKIFVYFNILLKFSFIIKLNCYGINDFIEGFGTNLSINKV